jgi:hypothetical protein
MLWIFRSVGQKNTNNNELSTNAMIDQRLDYIHMNPVKNVLSMNLSIMFILGQGIILASVD